MKNPGIRGLVQTLALTVAFLLASVGGICSSEIPEEAMSMNEIATKILSKWDCAYGGKVDIQIKFKLTNSGEAYNFNLTKGFENPYAVRAALHSILFGMPYVSDESHKSEQIAEMQCTISGDSKSPRIDVKMLEPKVVDNNELQKELAKVPNKKQYRPSMFACEKFLRLNGLCNCLYDYPDSREIKDEIGKISKLIGLDCSNSHDWVSLSRAGKVRFNVQRNPANEQIENSKAKVAALLQAYRIKRDEATLWELEDACATFAAFQVLQASKADPLLFGSAALLAQFPIEATKHLKASIKEGNDEAKNLLAQMTERVNESRLRPVTLAEFKKPVRTRDGWQQLLYWLPLDIELFMRGTPSSVPVERKTRSDFMFGSLVVKNTDATNILEPEELQTNKLFENCNAPFAIHAAREFDFGGGIGVGSAHSANILILGENSKDVASAVMNDVSGRSIYTQCVEGAEVFAFAKSPFSFAIMGGKESESYLCNPYEGVLIAATDVGFLREVILRMKETGMERALPAELPEWKQVDTSAEMWAIRHYDRTYVPFDNVGMYDIVLALSRNETGGFRSLRVKESDETEHVDTGMELNKEIGFVFSRNGNDWKFVQLSENPKTLSGLQEAWVHAIDYKSGEREGGPKYKPSPVKSKIQNSLLTIEATPSEGSLYLIQLLLSLGYFVAI